MLYGKSIQEHIKYHFLEKQFMITSKAQNSYVEIYETLISNFVSNII